MKDDEFIWCSLDIREGVLEFASARKSSLVYIQPATNFTDSDG